MTITVECGECGKGYKVRDEVAGKRFKCKKCAQPIRVPKEQVDSDDSFLDGIVEAEAEAPAYDDVDGEALPPAVRRKTKPKSKPREKRKKKRKQATGRDQTSVVMGVLCLLQGGGIYYLQWGFIGFSFLSLLLVAGALASLALDCAGVGILLRKNWGVRLAAISSIAALGVLALSTIYGLFSLFTMTMPGGSSIPWGMFFRATVASMLRSAAVPCVILWWSHQEPDLEE